MKKKKTYYLREEAIDTVKKLSEIAGSSESEVIEKALECYLADSKGEDGHLTELMLDAYDEKYSKWMTGVRLSSRQAERNTELIIECMNTLLVSMNVKDYTGTDTFESEVVTGARNKVKEDVDRYRQNIKPDRKGGF